jgi:hypothetical protein
MNTPINFARSLAAIFLGFLVLMLVVTLSSALTMKVMSPPPSSMLLAINVLAGLIAGYVVASLAGTHRWQHASLLAGIILCVGLLALSVMPGAPRDDYSKYALVLSPLGVIAGGWLRHRKA